MAGNPEEWHPDVEFWAEVVVQKGWGQMGWGQADGVNSPLSPGLYLASESGEQVEQLYDSLREIMDDRQPGSYPIELDIRARRALVKSNASPTNQVAIRQAAWKDSLDLRYADEWLANVPYKHDWTKLVQVLDKPVEAPQARPEKDHRFRKFAAAVFMAGGLSVARYFGAGRYIPSEPNDDI